MSRPSHEEYHNYLKKRTLKSKLYRNYVLYPRLVKYMKGKGLDLGSGIGEFLAFRPNTLGVDINQENVNFCVAQGLDCQVMVPDVLPFADCEFDSIIMDNVLEHKASPEQVLKEIDRVLKSEGILIVGVPGLKGYQSDPDHKIYYSKYSLRECFLSRGYLFETVFAMPLGCAWMGKFISQFCYYGVFRKP